MAPKVQKPDVSEISPEDKERYRLNPRAFIEEVLWVLDRDQPGVAVPFKLRPIQVQFLEAIQNRRAFNIWRAVKRAGKPALDILKQALKKLPTTAKSAVKAISALSPDKALELFPREMQIDDGPVAFIIGKPRQVGFSTLIEAILIWRAIFHPNFKAVLMAHEGESVENILRITSNFVRLWPEEKAAGLKPEIPRNATTKLAFGNGALFTIKTAGGMDSRGFKEDAGHFSEFAHYPDSDAVAASLIASPKHFWYFIESTANGKSGTFYEIYQKSKTVDALIELYDAGQALPQQTTTKFFIDWRSDSEYQLALDPGDEAHITATLTDYEKMAQEVFELTLPQLKWRRWRIENASTTAKSLTPDAYFAQEYPLTEDEMFQAVGSNVFSVEMLERQRLMAKERPPLAFFTFDGDSPPRKLLQGHNANLKIWAKPDPNEVYVMGADGAMGLLKGSSKDFCWASVFSIGDGSVIRQVAEFRAVIGQKQFGHICVTLAEWYNGAYIVPEANQGLALCDTIVSDCGYTNIFQRLSLDTIAGGDRNNFRFGFLTTGQSRQRLLEEFIESFRLGNIHILSDETLEQMAIFTRNELGKMEAPPGKHDDAVFAAALANFGFPSSRGGPTRAGRKNRLKKEAAKSTAPEGETSEQRHERQLLESIEKMAARERKRLTKLSKSGLATETILM